MQRLGTDILPTFIFIVTLLRNGACGTSGDAFSTGFVSKEEAVLFEMAVLFLSGRQFEKGDDAPDADSDPLRRDEAVIETESPEAGRIGDMALGPGRRPS